MRRDIGNEVIVAIVAVGVIAFAVIFGTVLSVSTVNQPDAATIQITPDEAGQAAASATLRPTLRFTLAVSETSIAETPVAETPVTESEQALNVTQVIAGLTVTSVAASVTALAEVVEALIVPTATESPTEVPTGVPTDTPSDTPAPTDTPTFTPSDTPTNTPIPTDTAILTETSFPTDTTTNTAVPTDTPSPTRTPSLTPTDTPTFTPTFTRSLTPTDTFTPVPTDTFTPTFTATFTWTSSPTDSPSKTFTPTFTSTLTPSDTPTFTPTLTPTATFTETQHPTRTPRPTLTPTFTPLPTFTDAPISGTCTTPPGWVSYIVDRTDTLFALAVATGSSVGELRSGNCLESAETPRTGDTLALPRSPDVPIPTFDAPLPDTPLAQFGCTDPGVLISAPLAGETVDGVISVNGMAQINRFAYYRIEVRPDSAPIFNVYARSETPVVDGLLAEINTALYGSGLHWIRLTVVQPNGEFPTPCAIPVIFR